MGAAPSDWDQPSPALRAGEIHVWLCDLDGGIGLERIAGFGKLLDERERLRHARLVHAADRHRFLVSHAFLRHVLARYQRTAPGMLRFGLNPHGKPFLREGASAPGFNLAHSGHLALLAIAPGGCELGADIEQHRGTRRMRELARRNFSYSEYTRLSGSRGGALVTRFHDLWALKESYVKARGIGLGLALDGFDFDPDPVAGSIAFDARPDVEATPGAWWFCSWRIGKAFSAALAIRGGQAAEPRWFMAAPGVSWSAIDVPVLCRSRRITVN